MSDLTVHVPLSCLPNNLPLCTSNKLIFIVCFFDIFFFRSFFCVVGDDLSQLFWQRELLQSWFFFVRFTGPDTVRKWFFLLLFFFSPCGAFKIRHLFFWSEVQTSGKFHRRLLLRGEKKEKKERESEILFLSEEKSFCSILNLLEKSE